MKVPLLLRELARRQRISLPVSRQPFSVAISDKVFLSLRTEEAKVAKQRLKLVLDAPDSFFDSLGQPLRSLSRCGARALAGGSWSDRDMRLLTQATGH